jgi:inositol-phosphate transport system permease protein
MVTNQTETAIQAPRAARGRWLLLAAGLVLLGCFVLPWLRFVIIADQRVALSLTGLQAATMPLVETIDGGLLYRSSLWLFLAPLAGAFALALGAISLLPGRSAPWHGLLAILVTAVAAVAVWSAFTASQEIAQKQKVAVEAQWGLSVAFLALLLLLVGGFVLLREASEQKPAFRGALDALNFMAPGTVLVIVFFFLPAIILFILSLTDLSSANFSEPWTYVGLDNYKRMFSDRFFPKILRNTFQYVILTLLFFNVGLALLLALLTAHVSRRAGFFFRLLWLLPRITPSVVYIVMWQRIAQQPPYGILNQFLGLLGVEHLPYWIPEAPWVFVVLVNGFVGASFGMIIFTSAIEAIPADLIIAAKVDGAGNLALIRDITLPLLRWPLLFVVTYQTLSLLVSFEYILLLTNGGPGLFTTEVWALTAYKRALQTYFGSNQWGYGAAWGFVLVIIGATLSIIYLRVFRFNDLVQEPKIDVL